MDKDERHGWLILKDALTVHLTSPGREKPGGRHTKGPLSSGLVKSRGQSKGEEVNKDREGRESRETLATSDFLQLVALRILKSQTRRLI